MEHPRHRGRFASFEGIDAWPRPVQRPGPPLIVGGESRAALVRAVTAAHGWYGFSLDLVALKRFIAALARLAAEHERPAELGRLEITVTPHGGLDRDVIERYEELGVDRLVLLPEPAVELGDRHRPVPLDRILRNIDRVAHIAPTTRKSFIGGRESADWLAADPRPDRFCQESYAATDSACTGGPWSPSS
jgi:alkanesulfonate monooxygenase SsuD/methylene tetrahydromethanopterin reductase-like flavin-dependent oxidoreductase (luciferase family)